MKQPFAVWNCSAQLYEQLHAQANRHDDNEMRLLTEIGTDALKLAQISRVTEAWKAYALGYEVLCEAVHDEEFAGIENAQSAITICA